MNSSKFQLIFTGVFAAFILIGVGFFAFGGSDQSGGNKTLSNHYVGSKFFLSSTH
jgi:hypothetical protein